MTAEPPDQPPGGSDPAGSDPGGGLPAGSSDPVGSEPTSRDAAGSAPAGSDHTDRDPAGSTPAAINALVAAAEAKDGAAGPGRPGQTLRFGVELRRQLARRRTLLVFGLLAALPLLLAGAFALGGEDGDGGGRGLADLATASAANFVIFTLFVSVSLLLPLVVALFFGDTIAGEASWSSLKYLLAIPVPRHRLLRQKALVAGALSAIGLLVLPMVALAVGLVSYGAGDALRPTGDAVPFDRALLALLLAVCYLVVHLSWVAGVALLLSVSTDAPLGAVGGAVLAAILSQILDQISALGDLRMALPTHYSTAWLDLIATDVDYSEVASGALVALVLLTVLGFAAARVFARKDITS